MKNALILHGWPQYRVDNYFLSNHLRKMDYKVIAPNMFTRGYVFSPDNVLNEVKSRLNGEKLDLIVGISLGGLIAPYIAKYFPDSKLIFIGSGVKLKSKSRSFNFTVKLAKILLKTGVLSLLIKLPDFIIKTIYKTVNPFTGDVSRKEKYIIDMNKNVKFIKRITIKEEKEILNFVTEVDNTNLVKTLKNKALIFSGDNDLLMPKAGGEKLRNLLINSKLVINSGSHFDTFTRDDLDTVDKFLQG